MPDTANASAELHILHWNIHSWRDADGTPNPAAVTALIADTKPHVVSLAEVNEPLGAPRTVADIADKCGYSWIFVPSVEFSAPTVEPSAPSMEPGPSVEPSAPGMEPSAPGGLDAASAARGYGNALLTRIPVLAIQQLDVYSPELGYDGTEPTETRSVILARLPFSGTSVWLGSTHFPATYHGNRVRAARTLMRLTPRLGTPWIICGDFNASPEALFDDHDVQVSPEPAEPTYPAGLPVAPIDYFLASPGIALKTEVLRVTGSDHLPIRTVARSATRAP